MKKIIVFLLSCAIFLPLFSFPAAGAVFDGELQAAAAVLYEPETGTFLYEKEADLALPPASVTKVMTILLICEAIDSGKLSPDESVTVSEYASSMGGSQVFLSPGEEMNVAELLKCIVVASANDAAVAMAEHLAGSEDSFVAEMNRRAESLGMKNTHFENVTGLDDTVTNHVTSARDIALMSAELILKHPKILEYSGIWMDSIRGGSFTLTNTNRLIRFYPGATGLKTGSTAKAKFCISATAERSGLKLIAVIMAAPTRDIRNAEAKKLLDFGFANYEIYRAEGETIRGIPLTGGVTKSFSASYPSFQRLVEKGKARAIRPERETEESYAAPIAPGEIIGKVFYTLDSEKIGETDIKATDGAEKIGFWGVVRRVAQKIISFCPDISENNA
ncbi:MAG: D-alanyl-D-alanine carboxypeptidase [Clostridia bacterium]|nr:D-alanyl-D-alanine carboxypeptidase [Clostridia bacterium]